MNASCIEGTGLGQLVARNRLPINIGNRNVVHHKLSLSSFNISFKRHSFFLVMDVWFCKTCMAWILDVDIVFPRQWCWSCQCMTTSYRHWQSSSLMGTEKGRTETRSLSLKRINRIVYIFIITLFPLKILLVLLTRVSRLVIQRYLVVIRCV